MRLADIGSIPEAPGCYQFFEDSICLYVGKARNLRQRLVHYLGGDGPGDPRIASMVARADRLEWTVLGSETEALLVEASLIRSLDPVYNIKLRTDHPYPSVAFDGRYGPARVRTWRGPAIDGVETFGPYPQRSSRSIVEAVVSLHRLANCDIGKYRLHERMGRPCLLGDIGRCSAPCVGRVERADYDTAVQAARELVGGKVVGLRERYTTEMQTAAAAQQYERAALARDRLAAVQAVAAVQVVDAAGGADIDVVGSWVDDVGGAACIMSIRSGALVGVEHLIVDAGAADVVALEYAAMVSLLDPKRRRRAPAALIVTGHLADDDVISLHRQQAGGRARIRRPRSADERSLLALAATNADEALRRNRMRRAGDRDARRRELLRLESVLGLRRAPLHIESVDISHLGGSATVSVVAVLIDGLPARNRYRRYRLHDCDGDDYAAMREVLTRRLADGIDGKAPMPDLLVIDGGAGQLKVAADVVAELGVGDHVELVALAKRLESVLRPGMSEPLLLDAGDEALLVLQRARDETHRASNRFQSRVAAGTVRRDWLDDVPGIGPGRKRRILAHFGGWRELEDADDEAIDACTFLPVAARQGIIERRSRRNRSTDADTD